MGDVKHYAMFVAGVWLSIVAIKFVQGFLPLPDMVKI